MKTKFLTFLSMIVAIGIGVNSAWGATCGEKRERQAIKLAESQKYIAVGNGTQKLDSALRESFGINPSGLSSSLWHEFAKGELYVCDSSCKDSVILMSSKHSHGSFEDIDGPAYYSCNSGVWEKKECSDGSFSTKIKCIYGQKDLFYLKKDSFDSYRNAELNNTLCGEDKEYRCFLRKDGNKIIQFFYAKPEDVNCWVNGGKIISRTPEFVCYYEKKQCREGYKTYEEDEVVNENYVCGKDNTKARTCKRICKCDESCALTIVTTDCVDGYKLDSNNMCVEDTTSTSTTTSTASETPQKEAGDECDADDLPQYATAGVYIKSGDGIKCAATKCRDKTYLVVNEKGVSMGWCSAATACPDGQHFNIIEGYKTDRNCVPDESSAPVTSEEPVEEEGAETEGADVSTSDSETSADTPTTGQDPCSVGGGTPGDDGTCKCEDDKTWNDEKKQCVGATDAGGDAATTSDEAQSGESTDGENSDGQNGERPEQGVAQEPTVDPAVECSENGGKWDAQSNQCITPEMQREIDRQKSQENVDKLKADADAAREREQSTENKLLGAAGIGATGIGGMMLAQSAAENAADDDAERAMRAYLATFRCDYGGGKTVRGGEQEIELPGGNELINLYSEYIALANDLKLRKEQLGLKPGIESEPILDGATSGLYDDIAVGKTGGAYTSLARALMDPKGADAAAWAAQRAETAKNLKTGAITAGVGAAGSLIANLAINEIGKKDGDGDDAKTNKYTSSLKTVTAGLRPESVSCPSGGWYPQCNCGGNDVYNPNTNTCDKCTNGFTQDGSTCICDRYRTQSGNMCISNDVVDSDGFISIDVIKLFKNNGTELTDNAKRAFDKLLDKLKSANVEECDVTINVYTDLVGDAYDNKYISDDRYSEISSYLEEVGKKYEVELSTDGTTYGGPVGCTCGVGEVPSGQEKNIEYSECVDKADDYVPERFAPCRRVEIKIECEGGNVSTSALMGGLGVISGSVSRQ